MNMIAKDILAHVGVSKRDGAPVGSGRYPLGSGENPNQRFYDFRGRVAQLKAEGMSEKDIAKAMGLSSTTQLRNQERVARLITRNERATQVLEMYQNGMTPTEIAKELGYSNESSVRSLLNSKSAENANRARVVADYIKAAVDEKGIIDIGAGVEDELGISREKLETALTLLEMEGYPNFGGRVPQVTDPNRMTTLKVVGPPGTKSDAPYKYEDIHSLMDYEQMLVDNGNAVRPAFVYPESMDSKRLQIVYNEQGGVDKDGLIELRRGVKDLDLGEGVNYAQVRILVDGDRYLKGMAAYAADDLPEGIDVRFNTNKHEGTPMREVLKKIDTTDPNNPFGSLIKERGGQMYYDDPNGKFIDPETGKKQSLSLINKRADEGDWGEWSKDLPSQFLSKQPLKTAEQQINLSKAQKNQELEDIMSVTVPEVRKQLLIDYADGCDSGAEHLKAAAFPGQKYQVIMPLSTVKDTEVYAPNFKDGSEVALIRFPHASISEIPILKVNNKLKEGKDILGNTPQDAIGISKAVADRMSGADFDGDTVLVIPQSDRVRVKNAPILAGLKGFDPKERYSLTASGEKDKNGNDIYRDKDGKRVKLMEERYKQIQMGVVSNLITDMTIQGASEEKMERAIRHSMVVIDAVKHKLDYRASEKENDIDALKREYQKQPAEDGSEKYGGAATLISRAKSETRVAKTQGQYKIDPKTGEKITKLSDRLYYDDNGVTKMRTQTITQMAKHKDARELISDYNSPMENVYADYANFLKASANEARKLAISTPSSEWSRAAANAYRKEVDSISSKLALAKKNAPRERQAQLIAASRANAIKRDNPHITKEELKKAKQRALSSARDRLGARRSPIRFTDREWAAILSNALNHTRLTEIVRYADPDELRDRTTSRQNRGLTPAKQARIKAMRASGYATADIAEAVGASTSTVLQYLNGKDV